MRLNEKTYPSLNLLDYKNALLVPIDKLFYEDLGPEKVKELASSAVSIYRQAANRYYLTKPFRDAIIKASTKIVKDMKHYENDVSDCGILFTETGFNLYLLNPVDGMVKMMVLGFTREGMTCFGILTNEGKYLGRYYMPDTSGSFHHDQNLLFDWVNSVLISLYFIHHCEIETKVVLPKEKYRSDGIKYYNESKQPFKVLDCRWFTDLIRDTPFGVDGHFRWQACGTNFSKRKLIWIEGYEKTGYRRTSDKSKNK